MAYDRYDPRQGPRDERSRWFEDRFEDRDRDYRGRDERGFFERAGEEIASWFGSGDDDDRHDRRPREQERAYRPRAHPDDERGGHGWGERMFGSGRNEDDRRWRDEDRARPSNWSSSGRDYNPSSRREMWGGGDMERERGSGRRTGGEREYRPITGDYGRSEGPSAASGFGRGGPARGDWRHEPGRGEQYGRSQSEFGRDEYRRTSFAGSAERSNHEDPHYHEWRRRQMDELDRDYDEYRRENRSRFESDFGDWRGRRQSKRQMMGSIRDHMEVVGNDGRHVGTVDRVAGDRIILTKSDPEAGGVHHSLSCGDIDRIEGDRVVLELSAEQAMHRWRDDSRGRALFEREDRGEAGPHMLDRSFSGTYR